MYTPTLHMTSGLRDARDIMAIGPQRQVLIPPARWVQLTINMDVNFTRFYARLSRGQIKMHKIEVVVPCKKLHFDPNARLLIYKELSIPLAHVRKG